MSFVRIMISMYKNIISRLLYKYIILPWITCFMIPNNTVTCQSLAFDLLDGKDKITIPFDYQSGYIVLDLKFHNSIPLKFIFDTGSESTILLQKEIAELMQLPYSKTINIQGADLRDTINGYICRNVFLHVDKLTNVKRDIIVLERDVLKLDKILGQRIQGIIGTSFFKGLIVQIDYKNNKLIIYDSRTFDNKILKYHKEIEANFKKSKAYINCRIQLKKNRNQFVNLLVDTGAGVSILLYDEHSISDAETKIPTGKMGIIVSGELMGYLGKLHHLSFGEFEFNNIISNLIQQDSLLKEKLIVVEKKGLIGNTILSRFNIVFDFLNGKIYFKAEKKYNEEFEYDKSGIELYATGLKLNRYLVHTVLDYSPAYFAGIKKGDIIKKLNGRKCSNRGLSNISNIFSRNIGTELRVSILRDQKVLKKRFILYDFLLPIWKNQKYIWPDRQSYDFY